MEDKIILYHQDGCGMCRTIEMMLKAKKIDYTSIKDIDTMIRAGINHTPVLVVNGKQLRGKEIVDWLNSRS